MADKKYPAPLFGNPPKRTPLGTEIVAASLSPGAEINGVLFNGTGNIDITVDAGTLTGTTLATAVETSSLTSLGVQAQNLDMGTHKIIDVVDPTNPQDAATKNYVDAAIAAALVGLYSTQDN